MFFNKNNNLAFLAFLFLAFSVFACVKTDFDEPPQGGEFTDIPTNITIKDFKKLHVTPGGFDSIKNDKVIGGIVTMDDRSGNYYKKLVIQDSTGGIEIVFNDGYQYTQFPIGRKIYIKCQGLVLTDYAGVTQLAGGKALDGDAQGLLEVQVRKHIVKGKYDLTQVPAPKVVSPSSLNADLISTLVTFEGVQFDDPDAGQIWADIITKSSQNRIIKNCSGAEVIVRSSGYANFAAQKTPSGKGKITGVLGAFNSDYQLYIRDLTDVDMSGARCGASSGNEQLMNIAEVRSIFTGAITAAPSERKIKGIVISDRAGNNLNNRNLFIQDATAGIVVRFSTAHTFNLGDEIEVVVSEVEISEFNKLLQLNNVLLANATLISTGKSVTPRTATIAEIKANHNAWESTLVRISNCTIPTGTLSGNKTVTDPSGTIAMFTTASATFSGLQAPVGPVTLTAIVSEFTTGTADGRQIALRNANDIQQ
jgi:hypothetical protein